MATLGRLEPVSVRTHWPSESSDFTPWLAESGNLALLADTLGIALTLEGTEQAVGPYAADIVCIQGGTQGEERRVVIENQFGKSDHDHLGKLLTYVAGTEAFSAVWIAERFTDEHRAAVEWLNDHSDSSKSFWALELQLWRIGESPPAPRFNVIVAPNIVTKAATDAAELSEVRRERLQFWQGFRDFMEAAAANLTVSKARPDTWVTHSVGKSGVVFSLVYTNFDLITQQFTSEQVTRVELVLNGATAHSLYDQLLAQRSEIDAEIGMPPPTWYALAAKERKIFVQHIWEAETDREAIYKWILGELQRLRPIFLPRVANPDVAP